MREPGRPQNLSEKESSAGLQLRNGFVSLTFYPAQVGAVNGLRHPEDIIDARGIFGFDPQMILHVLPARAEAEMHLLLLCFKLNIVCFDHTVEVEFNLCCPRR